MEISFSKVAVLSLSLGLLEVDVGMTLTATTPEDEVAFLTTENPPCPMTGPRTYGPIFSSEGARVRMGAGEATDSSERGPANGEFKPAKNAIAGDMVTFGAFICTGSDFCGSSELALNSSPSGVRASGSDKIR